MAYPRRCEGCGASYASAAGQGSFAHLTLAAEDGGTRSPWAADQPGRLLQIGCKLCGAIFVWDYFGPADDGRLGTSQALLRGPVANWQEGDRFVLQSGSFRTAPEAGAYARSARPQRRAS